MAGRHGGKRAGPRRPAERSRLPRARLMLLTIGVTVTIIAWGYLVTAAIDFGSAARSGDDQGWVFLTVSTLGAVGCLFVALILAARIVRLVTRRGPPTTSRHSATGTRSS